MRLGFGNKIFQMSSRSKLLILGMILSSLLIIITAFFAINNTQKKIFDSYYNFGQMMTQTLAKQTLDELESAKGEPVIEQQSIKVKNKKIKAAPKLVYKKVNQQEVYKKIKQNAEVLVKSNEDIAYISFIDAKGKTVYTVQKEDYKLSNDFIFNMPIYKQVKGKKVILGSVKLGLTGKTFQNVLTTSKNSMILIFIIAWMLSGLAVVVNTILLTRQITLLSEGVNRISTGEFGYTFNTNNLWGDIKNLFEQFNYMSSRLRKYEEQNIDKLTSERNKLQTVLMSIANGVIVCNNYDKIILHNNAALKILNLNGKSIINTKVQNYCDSNGELCFQEGIRRFKDIPLEEIESQPPEFQTQIDDKTYKATISPMFNINQDYKGYIIVLHDITKEARIDVMKNNFISNVSHELRTPVTILRSYIDTLYNHGNEFDYNSQKEFIGVINQEIIRMNNLVNNILDFSRLEEPTIKLKKSYVSIVPLIEMTVESMRVLAEERNITFSIIVEPSLPKTYINPENIERALKNIISNAIKYSRNGGKIKIRAEIDKFGNNIEISVEDNGIGISEEHLPHVFDRFYRIENEIHTIKGTGLGLHLVKIAIEKHHNGEVFVRSKDNEGSTFGFRLPIIAENIVEPERKKERTPESKTIHQYEIEKAKTAHSESDSENSTDEEWEISIEQG